MLKIHESYRESDSSGVLPFFVVVRKGSVSWSWEHDDLGEEILVNFIVGNESITKILGELGRSCCIAEKAELVNLRPPPTEHVSISTCLTPVTVT